LCCDRGVDREGRVGQGIGEGGVDLLRSRCSGDQSKEAHGQDVG
jgi:hypothetical protein